MRLPLLFILAWVSELGALLGLSRDYKQAWMKLPTHAVVQDLIRLLVHEVVQCHSLATRPTAYEPASNAKKNIVNSQRYRWRHKSSCYARQAIPGVPKVLLFLRPHDDSTPVHKPNYRIFRYWMEPTLHKQTDNRSLTPGIHVHKYYLHWALKSANVTYIVLFGSLGLARGPGVSQNIIIAYPRGP